MGCNTSRETNELTVRTDPIPSEIVQEKAEHSDSFEPQQLELKEATCTPVIEKESSACSDQKYPDNLLSPEATCSQSDDHFEPASAEDNIIRDEKEILNSDKSDSDLTTQLADDELSYDSNSREETFDIRIRCLGSDELEIPNISSETTIQDLKTKIQSLYHLDVNEQRILYKGIALSNSVNIPEELRENPSALQLIPFPNSRPNSDAVIKDVDDEINLLMNTSAEEVFDEIENSQVPTIQQFLIDMFRRTMNEYDHDFLQYQEQPIPAAPRFPEPWEINIHDFRRALVGLEELSADHLEQLLSSGADFHELSEFLLTFGTLFSSLSRLCCRVHPNNEGDLELRRGVNVEQIIVWTETVVRAHNESTDHSE